MCGSPCARCPPTVAALRTRMLESVRSARVITGANAFTIGERSSVRSVVRAPMLNSPSRVTCISRSAPFSRWRLTSRAGWNSRLFIISIKAVPPAIARVPRSARSSCARASARVVGSTNSNDFMLSRRQRHFCQWRSAPARLSDSLRISRTSPRSSLETPAALAHRASG